MKRAKIIMTAMQRIIENAQLVPVITLVANGIKNGRQNSTRLLIFLPIFSIIESPSIGLSFYAASYLSSSCIVSYPFETDLSPYFGFFSASQRLGFSLSLSLFSASSLYLSPSLLFGSILLMMSLWTTNTVMMTIYINQKKRVPLCTFPAYPMLKQLDQSGQFLK